MRLRMGMLLVVTLMAGCQQKTPTAAMPIKGQPVHWGEGFGTQQPGAPQIPKAVTTETAPAAGDAQAGQSHFGNYCARCHKLDGTGGNIAGMGEVPNLTSSELQSRVSDGDIAMTIMNGKGRMPPVANLDVAQIRALIAYVRSIKK